MVQRKNSHFGIKTAKATFNFNDTDSSGVAFSTVAAHGTGLRIPAGALILDALYVVNTTFTSAGDLAQIAIASEGAGDILAAVAIGGTNDPWDAGVHATLVATPALSVFHASNNPTQLEYIQNIKSKYILTTAEREITWTVSVEALTAGKITLYVTYLI